MAIPTLGAMIAAMGSPAEWGAVDTAKLKWDNSAGTFSVHNWSGNFDSTSISARFGEISGAGRDIYFMRHIINSCYGVAADDGDMWINYRGYQGGTSYYRDLRIGDGKGNAMLYLDGSAQTWAMVGYLGIGQTPTSSFSIFSNQIKCSGTSYFYQSDNSSIAYTNAAIMLREAQMGATAGYLAPRISFHWAGVVASQISIDSLGRIWILNNPGTASEHLVCNGLFPSGQTTYSWQMYSTNWMRSVSAHVLADGVVGVGGSTSRYIGTPTSFSSIDVYGSLGGYYGIGMSQIAMWMMWDGTCNGGFYTSGAAWPIYWNQSNTCLGVAGSTTSSTYDLYVNGLMYSSSSYTTPSNIACYDLWTHDGGVNSSSDEKLKKNIQDYAKGIDVVKQMRPIKYKYKDDNKHGFDSEMEVHGLSANELQLILPEAVSLQKNPFAHKKVTRINHPEGHPKYPYEDVEEGEEDLEMYLTINYAKVRMVMINAVKELADRVEKLEGKK